MVTLEQVKLLETKVGKAISYIEALSTENKTLREKLEGYRSRIDELETIVLAFKEDQGRIEAGIVSALERLNQFEDAVSDGVAEAPASSEASRADVSAQTRQVAIAPETFVDDPLEAAVAAPADEMQDNEASDDGKSPEEETDDKTGELDIF